MRMDSGVIETRPAFSLGISRYHKAAPHDTRAVRIRLIFPGAAAGPCTLGRCARLAGVNCPADLLPKFSPRSATPMAKELFGTDGIRGVPGTYPLDDATLHAA